MASGTSTTGNERPSIEHTRGDELSPAGTTAEQVEPADDCNRHTNRTKERLFLSSERRIHEKRLHGAWPKNEHGSRAEVDEAIHRRVLRCP